MTKSIKFLRTLLNAVFSIASVAIIVSILANVGGFYLFDGMFDMPYVILFAVLCVAFMLIVGKLVDRNEHFKNYLIKNKFKILLSVMAIIFVIQAVVSYIVYTPIGFDPFHIVRAAGNIDVATEREFFDHYFTMYPNNVLLTAIFKAFYRIMGIFGFDVWYSSTLLNIIAVDIGVIFTCLIANYSKSNRVFYLSFLMSIFMVATSPNILIPYSDTFSIPFTTGVILSVLMFKNAKKNSVKYISSLLLGVFLIGGYFIKPTVIIVGIAMIIYLVFSIKKPNKATIKKTIVSFAKCFACFVVGIIICYGAREISKPIVHYDMPTEEQRYDQEFPMTHFIMMGLNDGDNNYGFDEHDYLATAAIPGKNEKAEFNMQVAKQRASDLGIDGILKLYLKKAIWCISDGTFFYGIECDWFHVFVPKTEGGIKGTLQNWNYVETPFYQIFYSNFLQGLWLIIAVGLCLNILKRKNESSNDCIVLFVLQLTLVGMMMFLSIFEARSRYLILYLPYFILLASNGYNLLASRIKNRKNNK